MKGVRTRDVAVLLAVILTLAFTPTAQAQVLGVIPTTINPNSGDPIAPGPFLDACMNPNQWSGVRSHTKYLGAPDWAFDLMSDSQQSACFAQMNAAGLELSVEVGVLKGHCPTGTECYNMVAGRLTRMANNGAHIGMLRFDEPLTAVYAGQIPGHLRDFWYAYSETSTFASLIRSGDPRFSQAKLVSIEPWDLNWHDNPPPLVDWISWLDTMPANIDYFELDHDGRGPITTVNYLAALTRQNGLGFGLIVCGFRKFWTLISGNSDHFVLGI